MPRIFSPSVRVGAHHAILPFGRRERKERLDLEGRQLLFGPKAGFPTQFNLHIDTIQAPHNDQARRSYAFCWLSRCTYRWRAPLEHALRAAPFMDRIGGRLAGGWRPLQNRRA